MARKNRNARRQNHRELRTSGLLSKNENRQLNAMETVASAKDVRQQIVSVPLDRIVTEEYQRVLNMKNVNGIVRDFDPARLGVLVVNHRADGTYAILDGQHRLAALRRMGYAAANCIDWKE